MEKIKDDQESFFVITLNGNYEIVKTHEVTRGLVNRTIVHPREIFLEAIKDKAVAIIVAHNHPSGNVSPSTEDLNLTKKIFDSAGILGIQLLDHVIIGTTEYYSFQDNETAPF